jgi:hypothetical protein
MLIILVSLQFPDKPKAYKETNSNHIVPHHIKKFPALYGTRRFITFHATDQRTKNVYETDSRLLLLLLLLLIIIIIIILYRRLLTKVV